MVLLTFGTPLKVINANLVRKFVIYPAGSEHPDTYAIYAVYGKDDEEQIYAGELNQCESHLHSIMAKFDPSGHDRIEL